MQSGSEDGGITPGTQTHTRISYYYFGSLRVGMRQGEVGQGRDSVSWLHADHLGSVSEATTGSGGVSSRQRYFPYGRVRYRSGSPPTTYSYTGQRLDGTGLLFFQARYYDPTVGHFLSADSIVPDPANPQSLNRYAYVLNNPLKYTDPSGHCAEDDEGCWQLADTLRWTYGIFIEGVWSVDELNYLLEALNKIALEFGNQDLALGQKAFRSLFEGTRFVRVAGEGVPVAEWFIGPHRAMTGPTGNVYFPNGWYNTPEFAKFTYAHELAHVWDIRWLLFGGLSGPMSREVGARPAGMSGPYDPGPGAFYAPWEDPQRSPYAAESPSEDWAQSFAATIFYPGGLSQGRLDYVRKQIDLAVSMQSIERPPTPAPQPIPVPIRRLRGTPPP